MGQNKRQSKFTEGIQEHVKEITSCNRIFSVQADTILKKKIKLTQ